MMTPRPSLVILGHSHIYKTTVLYRTLEYNDRSYTSHGSVHENLE